MKKRIKQLLLATLVIGSILIFFNQDLLLTEKSTEEQKYFLPKMLENTEKVIIRKHPKLGGEILHIETEKEKIKELVSSTQIDRVTAQCACFGLVNIEFINNDSSNCILNYKEGEQYLSFDNPWSIQGVATRRFQMLITELSNSN